MGVNFQDFDPTQHLLRLVTDQQPGGLSEQSVVAELRTWRNCWVVRHLRSWILGEKDYDLKKIAEVLKKERKKMDAETSASIYYKMRQKIWNAFPAFTPTNKLNKNLWKRSRLCSTIECLAPMNLFGGVWFGEGKVPQIPTSWNVCNPIPASKDDNVERIDVGRKVWRAFVDKIIELRRRSPATRASFTYGDTEFTIVSELTPGTIAVSRKNEELPCYEIKVYANSDLVDFVPSDLSPNQLPLPTDRVSFLQAVSQAAIGG